eukprot:g5767.t1
MPGFFNKIGTAVYKVVDTVSFAGEVLVEFLELGKNDLARVVEEKERIDEEETARRQKEIEKQSQAVAVQMQNMEEGGGGGLELGPQTLRPQHVGRKFPTDDSPSADDFEILDGRQANDRGASSRRASCATTSAAASTSFSTTASTPTRDMDEGGPSVPAASKNPRPALQNLTVVQQAAIVKRVLHPRTSRIDQLYPLVAKNPVGASSTPEEDITDSFTRKDFLQLLQVVHPDKNSHPDAALAFDKLQKLWEAHAQGASYDEEIDGGSTTSATSRRSRREHDRRSRTRAGTSAEDENRRSSDQNTVVEQGHFANISPVPEVDAHSTPQEVEYSMCERSVQAMRIKHTDEAILARRQLMAVLTKIDKCNLRKKPLAIRKSLLDGVNDADRELEFRLRCFGTLGGLCWERYRIAKSNPKSDFRNWSSWPVRALTKFFVAWSHRFHSSDQHSEFASEEQYIPIKLSERVVSLVAQYCTNPHTRREILTAYHREFVDGKFAAELNDSWEKLLLDSHRAAVQAGFGSVADVQNSMLCVHERDVKKKGWDTVSPLMNVFAEWFRRDVEPKLARAGVGNAFVARRSSPAAKMADLCPVSDLPTVLRYCMPYVTRTIDRATDVPQAILVDRDFGLLLSIIGNLLHLDIEKENANAVLTGSSMLVYQVYDRKKKSLYEKKTASATPPNSTTREGKSQNFHLGTLEFNFKQNALGGGSKNALQNASARFMRKGYVRMENLSGDLINETHRAILLTNLKAVVHELGHALHFLHTPHQHLAQWGLALSPDNIETPSTVFELLLEEDRVLEQLVNAQPKNVRIRGVIPSMQGLQARTAFRVREENFWMCHRAYLENLAWGTEPVEFVNAKKQAQQDQVAHLAGIHKQNAQRNADRKAASNVAAYRDLKHFFLDKYARIFGMRFEMEENEKAAIPFHPLAVSELRLLFTDSAQTYPSLTYVYARCRAKQWFVENFHKRNTSSTTGTGGEHPITRDILRRDYYQRSLFTKVPTQDELWKFFFRGKENI